jgi:N6-adenosine-specific RNA methylase IME4
MIQESDAMNDDMKLGKYYQGFACETREQAIEAFERKYNRKPDEVFEAITGTWLAGPLTKTEIEQRSKGET